MTHTHEYTDARSILTGHPYRECACGAVECDCHTLAINGALRGRYGLDSNGRPLRPAHGATLVREDGRAYAVRVVHSNGRGVSLMLDGRDEVTYQLDPRGRIVTWNGWTVDAR